MHSVYFFTDVHGNYNLFNAITDWCFAQDPEATVIFGGDACDRGLYGYRIMQDLLLCPQIIYLKGNHEDLFTKAARQILRLYTRPNDHRLQLHTMDAANSILNESVSIHDPNIMLALANEGESTLKDWIISGADENIIKRIEGLPLTFSYENLDFCHAGADYETFKIVANAEHNGSFAWEKDKQDLLWDRAKIAFGWATERIAIFGHTPTLLLPRGIYGHDNQRSHAHPCAWKDHMGGMNKRGGWKIDMDTGAIWSNRAYVLDCLTMKVYGFEEEKMSGGSIIKNLESYKIIQ